MTDGESSAASKPGPETQPTACPWCGAKGDEPHDGATHDAYAASDPPGVGYNAGARDAV